MRRLNINLALAALCAIQTQYPAIAEPIPIVRVNDPPLTRSGGRIRKGKGEKKRNKAKRWC